MCLFRKKGLKVDVSSMTYDEIVETYYKRGFQYLTNDALTILSFSKRAEQRYSNLVSKLDHVPDKQESELLHEKCVKQELYNLYLENRDKKHKKVMDDYENDEDNENKEDMDDLVFDEMNDVWDEMDGDK